MAGNTLLPLAGYPLSKAQLARRMGTKDPIFKFLEHQALKDVVFEKYDFLGAALDSNQITVVTKGSTATEWATSAGLNGRIKGIGGTTAASSGLQFTVAPAAIFSGDKNAGFEMRFQIDDITEQRLEFGFVNAFPSINSTAVNSLTTPTFTTTTSAALYVYNHTGSTTVTGLYADGSGSVAANKTATTTKRPVNNIYQVVRMALIGDVAHLWIDGVYMCAAAIEGGDAMKLGVNCVTNSTNDHNILIDYIAYWVDRT
jgi:hypothetical protein